MRAEDRVLRVIGVITHIQMSDSIVYKQKIALLFFHHCLLKQLQEAISPLTGWYFQRSLSTTPFDNKKALHLFFFFQNRLSVSSVASNSLGPLWTVDHQAPLSMEFFRQEHWSGFSFPLPGDLLDPGIKLNPYLLNLLQQQAGSSPLSRLGCPSLSPPHTND